MIGLSQYQNFGNGAGSASASEVGELLKAMEAGAITGRETNGLTTASGAPLKVESLENTLKILTSTQKDVPMWTKIGKKAATNTVEEFNQLMSYGNDGGAFTNEGELPASNDSIYRRNAVLIKFMGTTREVTHPMQLVSTMVGNMLAQEVKNGTQYLMRQADLYLSRADSDMIPQEFDGFYSLHRKAYGTIDDYFKSEIVVDARGKIMTEQMVQDAAYGVDINYGFADQIVAPPVVFSDFGKNFLDKKLISPNTTQITAGVMGQKVSQIQTQFGLIDIMDDKFWRRGNARRLGSPSATGTPAAPTSLSGAVRTDTTTKFTGEDGDYWYAVAAENRRGEGPLTLVGSTAISVAATEVVDLTFTDGGGTNLASAYVIYRSKKTPGTTSATTDFYPIFKVSVAQKAVGYDGAAAGKVADRNFYIAGCEDAFIFEWSDEVLAFKQLAPLMKMDLAVLSPSTRFMILLYGAPILYAPKKVAKIVNIGKA